VPENKTGYIVVLLVFPLLVVRNKPLADTADVADVADPALPVILAFIVELNVLTPLIVCAPVVDATVVPIQFGLFPFPNVTLPPLAFKTN
jgi:hypothetical protein